MEANTSFIIPSETRDNTATPPPADEAPTHPILPKDITWTTKDMLFATMFCDWDIMPDRASNPRVLLQDLEDVIAPFEAYIKHSDSGFRKWRARHQKAMRHGAAEVPGWPRLLAQAPDGGMYWDDDVWVNRYTHLVLRRHDLALERLKKVPQRRRRSMARFFGDGLAMPRETLQSRRRNKTLRILGDCWWKPLNTLLKEQAYHWGVDAEQLKMDFWNVEQYQKVKAKKEVAVVC